MRWMPAAESPALAAGPGAARAVRRQLPERRHPPPAADARARLDGARAPTCSASQRRAEAPPIDAGRRRARAARRAATRSRWYENIPVAELAVAARPLLGLQDARSRRAIRWSRSPTGAALRGWSAGASAPQPVALLWCGFAAALVALAVIDWDTTLLPDNLTLPLLWAGLVARRARLDRSRCADARLGRRRRLPVAVVGLLALQADHRQGRHGLRRLQAARRARRLARLADDAADRPRRLGDRRGRRHRHEDVGGAARRPLRAVRPVPRRRRARRACSPGPSASSAGCAGPEPTARRGAWPRCASASPAASAAARARSRAMLASLGAVAHRHRPDRAPA